MSVIYCHDCDVHVDTDFNVEHFDSEGRCAKYHLPDGRKIVTSYEYPPIPVRNYDWTATLEDAEAELVDGVWVASHPIGHGKTEELAIEEFKELME